MSDRETTWDVAIVGAGLAGGLLARQIRRREPRLRIAIFEKETGTSFKVGEAIVEIAAHYLIRQGLSSYLYEHHLPKNGLRYFFDSEARDLPLTEMSEVGTVNLPFHPGFQLDRARMEADLIEMNRESGVEVHTGARVHDIELGSDGAAHAFSVTDGGGTSRGTTRWLLDAAGRVGLLARERRLRVEEPEHRVGSVWARFEGVSDLDDRGDDAFRARVRHTSRRLSTLHFWYPGYWVWFIPLRGGVTSVGLTGRVVAQQRELRTPEGFHSFLLRHRALGELIGDAKAIDHGSCARIAYGTRRFFDGDRWGLTGEAATAADPLYSPGSDFIALENDFLTDLIARDFGGEASEAVADRARLYDEFMQFRHEAAMRLYRGLYDAAGSFELGRLKWDFDIGCYYNLWVSSYMLMQHLDPAFLREQLRLRGFVLQALSSFAELFRLVERSLHERGLYFSHNAGQFYHGLTNIDFAEEVGLPRSRREVLEQLTAIFNRVRADGLVLAGRAASREEVEPLPLTSYLTGRALAGTAKGLGVTPSHASA